MQLDAATTMDKIGSLFFAKKKAKIPLKTHSR